MKKVTMASALALWAAVFIGGTLFLAAGRVDLPWLWANVLVWAGSTACAVWAMGLDLIGERSRVTRSARGQLAQGLGLLVLASHFVIAGLDVGRYHWSDSASGIVQAAALAVIGLGFALLFWTVRVNPFFAKAVRIQTDRGHALVTSGPYGHVRHPGYAAFIAIFLASGPALGSWLSSIPALGVAAFLAWRTAHEDAFLYTHLDGYADYAAQVPDRLIPKVW